MDAAFEAYIKLYHAGLVNHHMLPSPRHDEETERCLAEVKRRPAMAEIDEELNPWQPIAASWRSSLKLFSFDVRITSGREKIKMKMISPCPLPPVSSFALYVDAETTLQVEIGEAIERGYDQTNITVANEITQMFFSSAFPKRTKENESDFPLLFLPLDILDDLQLWLDSMNGTYQFQDIHSGKVDITKIGLVSDLWGNPYSLHAIEQDRPESSEGEVNTEANPVLKVMKLSKRADFLHRIASDASPASKELRDLDPNNCKFNRLSIPFALFARYIPSIMHRIQNSLILEHLCNGLLAPIVPSNRTDIYSAVSSPMAREDDNYQRLEFLGDAILKLLTSITLMAEHLLWHEGYLSSAKNHIVSNGRLALAAQETGLAKYIITTPFTGKKWRPLYNTELLSPQPVSPREVSTKVLADVVEALLGAAYLDGGFPKSFSFLRILIPEVKWLPLPQQNETLFSSVSSSGPSSSIPPNLAHLQSIIGHDFGNKTILLEAITHPSHISSPPTPSYQRLEFLGDAILDYLVTRTIWSHSASSPLTVPQMHTIRVAAVNGPFLAFCALSHTISIPITSIDHKPVPSIKGKRSKICPTSFSASARFLCLADFLRRAPSNALTSALALTRSRFEILHTTIRSALDKHQAYPWRELEAFAPEKFVSDLIESVLGAVYIDTRGDFDACERVAREFGIIGWVEQTLKKGGKILNPKHELGMMAVKEGVRYEAWAEKEEEEGEPEEHGSDSDSDIADGAGPSGRLDGKGVDKRQEEDMVLGQGKCRCKIFVGEREICEVQGWNRKEVEIAAAEEAVRILSEERKVKAEEKDTNGDEKEMGDEEKETDEEAEQEYFYECEGGEDDSET
jgi:dsRNA-specific ribonuclease